MVSKLLGGSLKLLSFLESPQLKQPLRPPLWFKHHTPESTVLLRVGSKRIARRQQAKCLWKSRHNKHGAPQPHKGHPWGKARDIRRPGPWTWERTTHCRGQSKHDCRQTNRPLGLCVCNTYTHTHAHACTYNHHTNSSSTFNTETSWLVVWCFQTVVLEKMLESPLDCKEIKPVNPKGNQSWIFLGKDWCWSSNPLTTWYKGLTHWKRPWCWERLRARGEGDDRGWDG